MLQDRANIEVIRYGNDVPETRRDFLLDRINAIISEHWTTTRLVWSRSISPFYHHFGIALLYHGAQIVGYAIYRRLLVGATLVIYRAGAGVSASCERQGVYHSMTRAIFAAEWPSDDEIYYSWRTRNPAIWIANTKFCRAVTPTPVRDDAEHHRLLQDVARELVKEMYPDTPLELPSMVMRHVYDHMTYRKSPRHSTRADVNQWFDCVIPDPADAILSVGIVTRSAALGD